MIRFGIVVIFAVVFALLAASYAGGLHPLGDSLALLAPFPAIVGLFSAFALRRRWLRGLGLALCAAALIDFAYNRLRGSGPAGDLVLYQKNLFFGNAQMHAVIGDIIASKADIITLQEVSERNLPPLRALIETHPHTQFCTASGRFGNAILSRYPIVEDTRACSAIRGMAVAQVETPVGHAWVVSLHLHWPYPYRQAAHLASMEPMLSAMDGPVIIGGDFNMTPGTRVTRRVARLTETQELRPVLTTFHLRQIPMMIDHVLAPAGKIEQRPKYGSDHHGLVGYIGLDRAHDRER